MRHHRSSTEQLVVQAQKNLTSAGHEWICAGNGLAFFYDCETGYSLALELEDAAAPDFEAKVAAKRNEWIDADPQQQERKTGPVPQTQEVENRPLAFLEKFLEADPRNESHVFDRIAAHFAKGIAFLVLLAITVVAFGVLSFGVSWLYGTAIEFVFNHGVIVLCVVAAIFVVGWLARRQNQKGAKGAP